MGSKDGLWWVKWKSRRETCWHQNICSWILLTQSPLFTALFFKHTKIKKNTLIHPIFTSLPHSMSVISAWRVLTEQSNLRVEHLVMCAWRGSGEFSFAPVSLLICFCAAWPSLGKVSPLKAGPSTGRQRGKKKKKHFQRRLSSRDSGGESSTHSLSSHNS